MNGCKYLAGRIRQRSSIPFSSLLPNCDIGSSVRRRSSFAATTSLTNGHSIAKRRRWSTTTQSSYVLHNNINRIQQHLRLQYFSTSTIDNDEDNVNGVDEEELKLISINDHLDELQHIPLEDVRNFCIIAHVVRFCSFRLFYITLLLPDIDIHIGYIYGCGYIPFVHIMCTCLCSYLMPSFFCKTLIHRYRIMASQV